jgi:hypothetical protein
MQDKPIKLLQTIKKIILFDVTKFPIRRLNRNHLLKGSLLVFSLLLLFPIMFGLYEELSGHPTSIYFAPPTSIFEYLFLIPGFFVGMVYLSAFVLLPISGVLYLFFALHLFASIALGSKEWMQQQIGKWEVWIYIHLAVLGVVAVDFALFTLSPLHYQIYMSHRWGNIVNHFSLVWGAIIITYIVRKNLHLHQVAAALLACIYIVAGISFLWLPASSNMIDSSRVIYSDIPTFSDTNGKYILNYDGDYWVTYYTDVAQCHAQSVSCLNQWEKAGNTSIAYSPIDLAPFIDKEVIITGEELPLAVSLDNSSLDKQKRFCLASYTNCYISTGPGVWYRSPLILTTIRLK